MAKGKKHPKKGEGRLPPDDAAMRSSAREPTSGKPGAPRASQVSGGKGSGPRAGRRTWMATHGRDLRFLLIFALLMGLYYAASTTSPVKEQFFPWYLRVSAVASGKTLQAVGYDKVTVRGNSLIHPKGAVSVERGCDAVEPCALFVSAVLASPVSFWAKLPAAAIGCALLMIINLVRIMSLLLTAVHWKSAFEIMHLDVWQSVFIFLAILFWALWASWETRRRARRHAAAIQT